MSNAATHDMAELGSFAGHSHVEYGRAVRHSRRVRRLKIGLPVLCLAVLCAFVGVSWVGIALPEGVSVESTAIENGKIVMRNPVMTGQSSDNQPYRLEAARAIQDLTTPDVIVLEDILAAIPVSATQKATLVAKAGTYYRAEERIVFTNAFTVTMSDGLAATLQSAEFNLKTGDLITSKPVEVTSPDASIVAQSMQMQDKGRIIVFENQVRMTIDPSAVRRAGATSDTVPGTISDIIPDTAAN